MDPADFMSRLPGEKIDRRKVKGLEFQNTAFARVQELLLTRMTDKCGLHGAVRLTNHDAGEVDFILCRIHPETGQEIDHHLFECKNYKRTLELSTTAKFFLIGLRRLPASLNLVSATTLQPQAANYARFFFYQHGEQPGDELEKPGGKTIFRHWVTHDLVHFDTDELRSAAGAETGASTKVSWELVHLDSFFERVVARSTDSAAMVDVYANAFYRIEAVCEYDRAMDDASFTFVGSFSPLLESGQLARIEPDSSNRVVRLTALLWVQPAAIGTRIALPALAQLGNDEFSGWPLPTLNVLNALAPNVDMRPKDSAEFHRLFAKTSDWRLMLLTGEAGTGKSWICRQFAEERRAYGGWDVLQFDVPRNADIDLLREMAVRLILPPRLRSEGRSELEQLATEVVRILAPLSADATEEERARPPVALAEFVAQAVVQLGPRLIIIRNCEQLTDVAARQIEQLVRAIERRGWGEARIILEGRDEETALPWFGARRELGTLNNAVRFHLDPMTRKDVDEWLERQFTAIVPELKDVCYRRGGGYPLLLQSLCDWLHAVGAIAPEAGRWRIVTSPTEFRRRLTVQSARYSSEERSDQILLDRLRSIDFGNCTGNLPAPLTNPYLTLGLFALAETPERMAALTEMLELGDTGRRLAAVLEFETLRDPAAPPGELRFRHDRYREAAVEFARAASDEELGALLRSLPPGDRVQGVPLELLGDVQELAGQHERAWTQYQRGRQVAEEADAYLDVCRIAGKQEDIFIHSPNRFPFAEYLRMLLARGWAEWNCGSMRTSRDTYQRVIREATSASDVSLNSTVARTFVAHAAWRLVGINLELADSRAFVESAMTALGDVVSAGDYNAVMNRLVLFCGRFGLPELGLSFVPFSLAQAPANSEHLPPDFPGDGAVICADVGRLFLDSMPERALTIFRTGAARSTSRRQQLWAAIDVLLADYLVTRELDSARCDALRDEAVRMGLYAFLVRLDLLRSADALCSGNLREAERLLSRARERIAVQEQPCYEVAMANNAVISALLSGDNTLIVRRMRELARCVKDGVNGRESAWPELAGPIRDIVVARWKRYEPSPLSVPLLQETTPPLCSSLMRAWFNLRGVAGSGDPELAAIAAPVADPLPSFLDLTAAQLAFDREAERCAVSWNDTVLALCVE